MGDVNQVIYLQTFMPTVSGPVLEVGSKDHGNTASFRDFYASQEYVGIDMEPGAGVDMVLDLTQGVAGLPKEYFALAICCSVLEHVRKPWVFAEHLTSLVRPGGTLFMSVPWVWRYHPYPDDYFRFSWRGIIELFPAFTWSEICYATNLQDELFDLDPRNPGIDDAMAVMTPNGRKHLPYLMISMLGQKAMAG